MRNIGRIVPAGGLLFLLVALSVPVYAQEQWTEAVPARVRHFEGSVTVQRAYAGETSEAVANLPLDAGDRLWTGDRGRAEVIFHDGTLVWLDEHATLDVLALPRAAEESDLILRLWGGSAIVYRPDDVRDRLRVDTPDASALLAGFGLFRIDVEQGERVWLSAYEGRADLVAGGLTEFVLAGERSYVEPGTAPAEAVSFNTAERDGFDSWYGERMRLLASTERHVRERSYVPRSVVHYAADLEGAGSWFYYDDFNAWAWRPVVSYGWEPYRYGRWVYSYGGWTWVPQARWGWATSHYGRWHHVPTYGWIWFPGYVYSPGWVSWYVGGGYIGWSPLGYYNRPFVSFSLWYGGYHGYGGGYHGGRNYDYGDRTAVPRGSVVAGRGYTAGPRGWNVVPASDLGRPDADRHVVERSVVRATGDANSISLQGPLRPRDPTRLVVQGGGVATSRPSVGGGGSAGVVAGSATSRPVPSGVVRGSGSGEPVRGVGSGSTGSRPSVPTSVGSSVRPRPSSGTPRPDSGGVAVRPRPTSPAGSGGSGVAVGPRPATQGAGGTTGSRPVVAPRPAPSSAGSSSVSPRPGSGSGYQPYTAPSIRPRGGDAPSPRPQATTRPGSSTSSVAPRPSGVTGSSAARPAPPPSRPSVGSSPARPSGGGRPAVSRGGTGGGPKPSAPPRGSGSTGSAKPRTGGSSKPRKPGGGSS